MAATRSRRNRQAKLPTQCQLCRFFARLLDDQGPEDRGHIRNARGELVKPEVQSYDPRVTWKGGAPVGVCLPCRQLFHAWLNGQLGLAERRGQVSKIVLPGDARPGAGLIVPGR